MKRIAISVCLSLQVAASAHGQLGFTIVDQGYESLAADGSTIVALNSSSDIYSSEDGGANFTLRASATTVVSDPTADFHGIGLLEGTSVAVGVDGLVVRSGDSGVTWSAATSPSIFGSLRDVAARSESPNRWVAVGNDGFDAVIYRSVDDGANWTSVSAPVDVLLEAVVWTGNRWLAAGADGSALDGVVYSSTDGTNWSVSTLPAGASPLLDLAVDTLGTVIAVGESGQLLRSVDDGLSFTALLPDFVGGVDLNAVVVEADGTFVVGGFDSILFEIDGTVATELVPATAGGESIKDLVIADGERVVSGPEPAPETRTDALALVLEAGGTFDFTLTVSGTLTGKVYLIQSRPDLSESEWTNVAGLQKVSSGTDLTFDVGLSSDSLFWRAVEF